MSTVAGASPRAVLLDPDEQRVIEEQRARRLHSLAHREVWSFGLFAGGFLAVAVLMAALLPSHRSPGIAAVLVLIAAYAASFRLDFEIGSGSAVPTQLMLVPMLFVLPAGFVPIAVAAGIVLGSLDEYLRGSLHLGRVVLRVVNAWHAVGPALVLGLAVERGPRLSDWPLYTAALLAQFVLDDVCAAGREWIALGVRPSVQLRAMVWVHSIDAGLSRRPTAWCWLCRWSGCFPSSLASGGFESTTSSSSGTPTAGPPSCSGTWSRLTTPTRASTAVMSSS
jgi:hypothetical protein